MERSTNIVKVGESGIRFLADADVPFEAINSSSVLVGVSTLGAWIPTGTYWGVVEVTLEQRSTPPDAYQVTGEWEEVSEVTVFTNTGLLELWGDMEDDDDDPGPVEHPQIGDGSTAAS